MLHQCRPFARLRCWLHDRIKFSFNVMRNPDCTSSYCQLSSNGDTARSPELPSAAHFDSGLERLRKLMQDFIPQKRMDLPDRTLNQLREEYLHLDWDTRRKALHLLSIEFGVDRSRAISLAQHYLSLTSGHNDQSHKGEHEAAIYRSEQNLRTALMPSSARLFEEINGQVGGLKFLIDLRADLLRAIQHENRPSFRALDSVLKSSFITWLSPACLELHQVTWNDSASLLEKIIDYEAVHPISSFYDLKRRVGSGRRCFGYFHPSVPGEPLIFIEVALMEQISNSIQEVLVEKPLVSENEATIALFYSISSTQPGLAGIDLGHYLIKRVVHVIRQEIPQIQIFATLSPVPGFLKWLIPKLASKCHMEAGTFGDELLLLAEETALLELHGGKGNANEILLRLLSSSPHAWSESENTYRVLQMPLMRLCARYLLKEKKRGRALDPVANFHLRNGAVVERLNWMGDTSSKGLKESAGIMVNYLYRLENIEENSQAYFNKGIIAASPPIKSYLSQMLPSAL